MARKVFVPQAGNPVGVATRGRPSTLPISLPGRPYGAQSPLAHDDRSGTI